MSKKNFKDMIAENQRRNNIRINLVHLTSQTIENKEDKKNNKNKFKNNKNLKNMKNNKSIVMMAFSKGRESAEATEVKRYIGVASCKIVAINPNKAALDAIYGRPSDKEPNYLGEQDNNGVKLPQARIDIFFKLDDKYLDDKGQHIDTVFRKSIFLPKTLQANRDNTKFKVVDEYGNTAWVTKEQLDNHEVPMYSNGPASITKNYRALYRNEEIIMNIMRVFLRVTTIRIDANGNTLKYNNASKAWEPTTDASDGLSRFDNIEKYFTGDFTELQEMLTYQPNNKVKVLFGVKNSDGKMYQDIYDVVLGNGTTNYERLDNAVKESKANGGYPNTEFRICEFQEYSVTPTNFNNAAPAADPFANAQDIF